MIYVVKVDLYEEVSRMKNIFNRLHSEELVNRLNKLSPNLKAKWGKMNVSQTLAHCSSFQDIAIGHSVP